MASRSIKQGDATRPLFFGLMALPESYLSTWCPPTYWAEPIFPLTWRYVVQSVSRYRAGNGGDLNCYSWRYGLSWLCLLSLHFLCVILYAQRVTLVSHGPQSVACKNFIMSRADFTNKRFWIKKNAWPMPLSKNGSWGISSSTLEFSLRPQVTIAACKWRVRLCRSRAWIRKSPLLRSR